MQHIRLLVVLLLSVILFQSCRKNDDTPDVDYSGNRLRSVVSQMTADRTTHSRTYFHDTLNRLTSVLDSTQFPADNGGFVSTDRPTSIEYDIQGRVKQITGRYRLLNDAIYDLWQYNLDGLPQTRTYISELEQDTVMHFYTYDSQKRLIKDSLSDNKHKSLVGYTIYIYDGRDNIVEWNRFSNESGVLKNVLQMQATYDNNPNPFRTVGSPVFTSWYESNGMSKNNMLQVVYSNGMTGHYQYMYYSNGFPKSALFTSTSPQAGGNQKIIYKYEL